MPKDQQRRGKGNQRKEKPEQPTVPCRTLFVRNVQYESTLNDVKEKFEPFGDIKTTFDLISGRGLAFITFVSEIEIFKYDLRAAEKAMEGLKELQFGNRKADVHYSLPKEGDQEKNQATIEVEVSAEGTEEEYSEDSLREYMSKFGEIRSIRSYPENTSKYSVSYWDSRHCKKALDEIPNENKKLKTKLGWDEGQEPVIKSKTSSNNYHDSDHGRRDHRREHRDNHSDRRYDRDRRDRNNRYNDPYDNRSRNDYNASYKAQPIQPPMINPMLTAMNPLANQLLSAMMQNQMATANNLNQNNPIQQAQSQQLLMLLSQMNNQQQQPFISQNPASAANEISQGMVNQLPKFNMPDQNVNNRNYLPPQPTYNVPINGPASGLQQSYGFQPPIDESSHRNVVTNNENSTKSEPTANSQPTSSQAQLQALAALLMQNKQKQQ